MRYPNVSFIRQRRNIFIKVFVILFLTYLTIRINTCSSRIPFPLKTLVLDGYLSFDDVQHAARDFGNRYHYLPLAVLHPKSVLDIANTIKHVLEMGSGSDLTVAARGHGHSLQGQSQAHQGVVINMESLRGPELRVHNTGRFPYVDVYLTVGGTLSNAGISGQAFRHGPQISNVHQLEVVTGKGEVLNCSDKENSDLFHSVLGGLGQFGIITRAQIALEPAPLMVKWIRVLYTDFSTFTRDQEFLISTDDTFDYIEGFVIINRTGLLNNWRSSFKPQDPVQASHFQSEGKTLYCLELTKNFNPDKTDTINQEVRRLLSRLSYISSTLFISEVLYVDFLDRVRVSEIKLSSKGLWEVPHPWLNLLIPKSKIHAFAEEVFGNILTDTSNGPILIYPAHKSKWDNRTSFVNQEEDIFYLVAFLTSALPSSTGTDGLEYILTRNKRILDFCKEAHLGVKQYLPHYTTQEEWQSHFGSRWELFEQRKTTYDPLAILAPGQRIFQKAVASS